MSTTGNIRPVHYSEGSFKLHLSNGETKFFEFNFVNVDFFFSLGREMQSNWRLHFAPDHLYQSGGVLYT